MNEKLNAAMTAYAASPTEANRAAIAEAVAPELLDEIATLKDCLFKREQSLIDAKKRELADPFGGIEILEHPTLKRAAFANDQCYALYMAERASREQPAAVSIDTQAFWDCVMAYCRGVGSEGKALVEFVNEWGNQRYFDGLLIGGTQPAADVSTPEAWIVKMHDGRRVGTVFSEQAAKDAAASYGNASTITPLYARAAAPSVSAPADERAAFEAWAANNGMHDLICEGNGSDRQYLRDGPYMCWKTWQAARAAVPSQVSAPTDEPSEAESLIACLEDDAAKLKDANPDDEMAQTMLDAAAFIAARAAAPVSSASLAILSLITADMPDEHVALLSKAATVARNSSAAPVSGQGATLPDLPAPTRRGYGLHYNADEMSAYGQLCIDSRARSEDSRPTYIKDADQQGGLCASVLAAMYASFKRGDSVERVHAAVMGLIGSEDSRAKVLEEAALICDAHESLYKGASVVSKAIRALASTTPPKADNE